MGIEQVGCGPIYVLLSGEWSELHFVWLWQMASNGALPIFVLTNIGHDALLDHVRQLVLVFRVFSKGLREKCNAQ